MSGIDFSDWKKAGLGLIWLLLEAWLGKTDKTKYGSTLELIVGVVIDLIKKLFKKGETK
jgi:hypothetical protein